MSKLHVFIDTNIFLSFYAYTNDDLEQLRKLGPLIKTSQLKLYLPEQVRDEFVRNREGKLSESLKAFTKDLVVVGVPRFMEGYLAIKKYRESLKELEQAKVAAIAQAKKEASEKSMVADLLFEELLEAADVLPVTEEIIASARQRKAVGNPPGKDQSLGDEINWEILLSEVEDGTPLHVISKDGDFGSPLSPSSPRRFLIEEWKQKKNAELLLYTELRPFLTKHFPDIKLAVDVEKRAAIVHLKESWNFQTTHSAISELMPFLDILTGEERTELLAAAAENTQIAWIRADPDVSSFYSAVLNAQHDAKKISETEYGKWLTFFGLKASEEDIEIPF